MIFFSGVSQAYQFGEFPPLIAANNTKYYVMALFGGVDALCSFVLGRLSDKIGRRTIIILGSICYGVVFLILLFWIPPDDQWFTFGILGILLAIGDSVMNTQLSAILGTFFEKDIEAAFANFKLVQSGATAIIFFYRSHLGFQAKSIITLIFWALGLFFILIEDIFYWKLDGAIRPSFDPEALPLSLATVEDAN